MTEISLLAKVEKVLFLVFFKMFSKDYARTLGVGSQRGCICHILTKIDITQFSYPLVDFLIWWKYLLYFNVITFHGVSVNKCLII